MIALEALSEFAMQLYSPNVYLTVTVSQIYDVEEFLVTPENMDVLRIAEVRQQTLLYMLLLCIYSRDIYKFIYLYLYVSVYSHSFQNVHLLVV